MELVYVWVTTAKASTKLLTYTSQQQDLIVVHREASPRLCPLLDLAPESYTVKPLSVASTPPRAQRGRGKKASQPQRSALPEAHDLVAQVV